MYYIRHCSNWWLAMIAFGFLPENFDRWRGPTNSTSLFYESRFSGGNTHRWIRPGVMFELFAITGGGDAKIFFLCFVQT